MNLKERLKDIGKKTVKFTLYSAIGLGAMALIFSTPISVGLERTKIRKNLEGNSPFYDSVTISNIDLDKNGKYETVINYKNQKFLLQYDQEEGYLVTKPFKLETQYDSLKNKETIKIVE